MDIKITLKEYLAGEETGDYLIITPHSESEVKLTIMKDYKNSMYNHKAEIHIDIDVLKKALDKIKL